MGFHLCSDHCAASGDFGDGFGGRRLRLPLRLRLGSAQLAEGLSAAASKESGTVRAWPTKFALQLAAINEGEVCEVGVSLAYGALQLRLPQLLTE